MEAKATKITKAIMPIIAASVAKVVTNIAEAMQKDFDEKFDQLDGENKKIAERIFALTDENKQLSATNADMLKEAARKDLHHQEIVEQYKGQIESLENKIVALNNNHNAYAKEREDVIRELNTRLHELAAKLDAPTEDETTTDDTDTPKAKALPMPKDGEPIRHPEMDFIMDTLEEGCAAFLNGPAGTGKSVIAKMIADELGLPFYVSSQITQEYQIEGFVDAHGIFNSVPFYEAFSGGGVFVLEEMDASSEQVLVRMNTALANGYLSFPGKGLVKMHPDFRCIATGNTVGSGADDMYTGRVQLDSSTLDRFIFHHVDYDERIEVRCADGDKMLVQFVHDLRRAIKQSGAHIPFVVSYRGISNMTKFTKRWGVNRAMQSCIVKGMDADNVELLYNNLTYKNTKYAKAFKACGMSDIESAVA